MSVLGTIMQMEKTTEGIAMTTVKRRRRARMKRRSVCRAANQDSSL
jgi:hypothetical protein